MKNDKTAGKSKFEELAEIVAKLRKPEVGCPWDRQQTHQSLKPYLLEEAYEVMDAIDGDPARLKDELGDVLLQVLLHSQIADEDDRFNIEDVIEALSKKLIYRHPHVFGNEAVKDAEEVLQHWERLKQKESNRAQGLLASVPLTMPALLRAHRIGEKVARVGFDWETPEDISLKVKEELEELLNCSRDYNQTNAALEEEFGDVLFTVAQLARKLGLNSENVLRKACDKFSRRFARLEELAETANLGELPVGRLEELWQQVKKEAL